VEKVLRCGELFEGCATVARAESDEEVLKQAAGHAKRDHGISQIDAATLAKVKAAIRTA
jgi:predicted small metal-binding protein